ncbi:hypothetical protein BK126_05235 [Paenibacillus sp. FSL H7-0326]|uniref:cysteine hydrolase family protein n=1 Tax=Paenibacillus sp. FSL H7-0326 TaxID=1921144 RepID=UPI00096D1204|nr:isochorismatase family cysteine hydrolase [Paenibacillus sp. FSL H7-0326]OMC71483.1 hypothetical protein BK126_05235 [Paenibacillus sp. FSL H7-0326]
MENKIPGRAALLIIDAQNGFIPSKTIATTVIDNISRLAEVARKLNIPVLYSREIHRKELIDFGRELEGTECLHCLENSEEIEIIEELYPQENDYVFTKRRYSCFKNTDLPYLLRGLRIDTLLICGFLTDVCVHYTSADAHQEDYYIRVAEDAVQGSSESAHSASLQAIKYLQRDAILSTDNLIRLIIDSNKAPV